MATRCESGVDFEKIDFESLSNMKNYISKGSFGAVYGPFTWNSKKFAVKHILIGHEIPDQFEAKVEAKKNIWTSLKHEHLIEIHYVSLKPKAVYVVMEYASGGSLRQLLDNSDAKNHLEIYVSNWARQIAEGMLYLHDRDRPIVHRDLKSSNIVVMEPFDSLNAHVKRTLKITDFDNVQEHVGTATMSLSGTCTHMAPEVLLHQRFSKASDVWSYGVVIWEMLTRELPHKGQAVGPLVMKASSGELTLSIPDSVPKEIKELLGECWCQDTKSRLRFKNIIDRLNSISDSENAVSDISTVNKTMNDEIHCNANTSQSCSYKWRWLQDNDFTVESSTAVLKARKPGWHRCEAECYLRNETCKLLVLRALIHGETESSQEGAMISYVVIPAIVTLVVVGALIFVFFWIRRRRVRNSCVSREEHAPLIKEHPESHAVIRNHQFLEEHIESSPVIHLLHEKNCITDVKRDQFLNHPSNDYRNEALLQWMRTLSFNEYKGQKVLECFRQTKQNFVADVLEKGGGKDYI